MAVYTLDTPKSSLHNPVNSQDYALYLLLSMAITLIQA